MCRYEYVCYGASFEGCPWVHTSISPTLRAFWMTAWVRQQKLASARHVQLSVKMSVAVSRSMSQSSSFEESCVSNMGISWSKDMVMFASLCVACKVFVGFGYGWSLILRYFSLSVSCVNSTICMGWWVSGSKWMSWYWSCWNCFCKGQWLSGSSQYTSNDLLYHSGIAWSGGTRSRGKSPGEQKHPQCHDFHILSWCGFCDAFQGCLTEPSGVTLYSHQTCACCSGWAGYKRQRSLARQWLCWALLGWSFSMYCEGLHEVLSVGTYQWSGEHLIHLQEGIFDCSTVRSHVSLASRVWLLLFTQVLSLIVEQWCVVGCFQLYWFF